VNHVYFPGCRKTKVCTRNLRERWKSCREPSGRSRRNRTGFAEAVTLATGTYNSNAVKVWVGRVTKLEFQTGCCLSGVPDGSSRVGICNEAPLSVLICSRSGQGGGWVGHLFLKCQQNMQHLLMSPSAVSVLRLLRHHRVQSALDSAGDI
jgi:hypothetical protein